MNQRTERHEHQKLRQRLIVRLFNAQQGLCAYCGQPMRFDVGSTHPARATKDHVIPRAHGGPSAVWNYVAACRACNQAKADLPLDVFLSRRKFLPHITSHNITEQRSNHHEPPPRDVRGSACTHPKI